MLTSISFSSNHIRYDIHYGTNINHINSVAQIQIQDSNIGFIKVTESNAANVKRFSNTDVYYHRSIQEAVNAATEFDTIFISPGIYTEDIIINKPGITIQGSGSGNESYNNNDDINVVGGTIINGYIRINNEGINCKIERLSFMPNNPFKNTDYNLAFFGSSKDVVFNGIISDVAFYGDGYCAHNVEFRGKKWYCYKIRSYNAGIHNFVIKAADSAFNNLLIDNKGKSNASFLFIKSHSNTANLGSPISTVVDGFKIIMTGSTSYSGIHINNANEENEVIDGIWIKNGIIENKTSNNFSSIRILGNNYANNIIKNIYMDNVACSGGGIGAFIQNGYRNNTDRGIDTVIFSNCSFSNINSLEQNQFGIVNGGEGGARNIFLNKVFLRNYPEGQEIGGSFSDQNIHIISN